MGGLEQAEATAWVRSLALSLFKHAGDMGLGGVGRDAEQPADLLIGEAGFRKRFLGKFPGLSRITLRQFDQNNFSLVRWLIAVVGTQNMVSKRQRWGIFSVPRPVFIFCSRELSPWHPNCFR
jgi:hypothetical protein